MLENFIRERITELRLARNVSEYQMSAELGKSPGYVQSITSGRTMPSMEQLFNIIDYFDMTPSEFFDPANHDSQTEIGHPHAPFSAGGKRRRDNAAVAPPWGDERNSRWRGRKQISSTVKERRRARTPPPLLFLILLDDRHIYPGCGKMYNK